MSGWVVCPIYGHRAESHCTVLCREEAPQPKPLAPLALPLPALPAFGAAREVGADAGASLPSHERPWRPNSWLLG